MADSNAPVYKAPEKGSEYEEYLVTLKKKEAVWLGIDLSKAKLHHAMRDSAILSIDCKYLMEANPSQYISDKEETGLLEEGKSKESGWRKLFDKSSQMSSSAILLSHVRGI